MNIFELLFGDMKKELERVSSASIRALDYQFAAIQRMNKRVGEWMKENPNKPILPHIMIII